ncbi:MAG: O-antigen ligase family protein [Candidatus Micrarchaeaceae archaeon]
MSFALPRIAVDAFAPYTALIVILALLLGGGSRHGFWSDALLQLAAIPLFIWALLRLTLADLSRSARWAIVLLLAILVLPFAQMVPLPPALWTLLPGRGEIVSTYQATGMNLPWLSLSLDPAATLRALLSLLPATAVFLAMLSLEMSARHVMTALILILAFCSVPLDLMQMMGGDQSSLRFYEITNTDRAVGFFANANHNAALLYCTIPFAAAWMIGLARDRHKKRFIGILLLALLIFGAVLGIVLTRSRAGLALALLGGLCSLAIIWRNGDGRLKPRFLLIGATANLIALLVAFQFGFASYAQRAENNEIVHDLRWPIAHVTAQAAVDNLPFGTGFGSFVPIYQMHTPRTDVRERYINHAHDDWLELFLTGGVAAAVIALGFLVWFAILSIRVWRDSPSNLGILDVPLAQAASLVVLVWLLHSTVDYPLRTGAISVIFAIACALLIRDPNAGRSTEMVAVGEQSSKAHAREYNPNTRSG